MSDPTQTQPTEPTLAPASGSLPVPGDVVRFTYQGRKKSGIVKSVSAVDWIATVYCRRRGGVHSVRLELVSCVDEPANPKLSDGAR